MVFTVEILRRPTIKKVTDYLLYGASNEKGDGTDYHKRLKKAYQRCEDTLALYDTNKDSVLYQAVLELMNENEKVYMEIGFQSGLLLMQDAIRQTNLHHVNENAED